MDVMNSHMDHVKKIPDKIRSLRPLKPHPRPLKYTTDESHPLKVIVPPVPSPWSAL